MPPMPPRHRAYIWLTWLVLMFLVVVIQLHGQVPDSTLTSQIHEAADRYDIPRPIASALVRVESGFNPSARSVAGALGLTQVMPATGALVCGLRRRDLLHPVKNLDCGFSFLSRLYLEKGSWYHALVAYHRGPAVVKPGCCYARNTSTDYALTVLKHAARASQLTVAPAG